MAIVNLYRLIKDWIAQWFVGSPHPTTMEYGVTFSYLYANSLGLDWKEAYKEIIRTLGISYIRLPIYWNELEPKPGIFIMENLDWQLEEARKANVQVLLTVGYRSPRWPECYPPNWVLTLKDSEFKIALLDMISCVINYFKEYTIVEAWQVENEPFETQWGINCRDITDFILDEINLVHSLDDKKRPVIVTYSNLPWLIDRWKKAVEYGDIAGADVYNKLWYKSSFYEGYIELLNLGLFSPLPLAYQKSFAQRRGKQLWVTELQAEPWGERPVTELKEEEAYTSISPSRLLQIIKYVKNNGITRVYLWGAEWWIYQRKIHKKSAMWNTVSSIICANQSS